MPFARPTPCPALHRSTLTPSCSAWSKSTFITQLLEAQFSRDELLDAGASLEPQPRDPTFFLDFELEFEERAAAALKLDELRDSYEATLRGREQKGIPVWQVPNFSNHWT